MDYVTRQFITLTKKFRKEFRLIASRLSNALEKHAKAINESTQTADRQQSAPPEITIKNEFPDSVEVHQNADDARNERNYKRAMFFVTALSLGGFVIYATLVFWQYRETQAALSVARTSNEITKAAVYSVQRAFVFVNTIEAGTTEGGNMRVVLKWFNGGETPTRFMTSHVSVRRFENPMPAHFGFPDYPKNDPPTPMFVGPKAESRAAAVYITANDLREISEHHGHLYLWGWARYRDVFPDSSEHITRFCSEVVDVVFRPGNVSFATPNCQQGNCTDEECVQK